MGKILDTIKGKLKAGYTGAKAVLTSVVSRVSGAVKTATKATVVLATAPMVGLAGGYNYVKEHIDTYSSTRVNGPTPVATKDTAGTSMNLNSPLVLGGLAILAAMVFIK
jgi:hypothetical protein